MRKKKVLIKWRSKYTRNYNEIREVEDWEINKLKRHNTEFKLLEG